MYYLAIVYMGHKKRGKEESELSSQLKGIITISTRSQGLMDQVIILTHKVALQVDTQSLDISLRVMAPS